MPTTTQPSYNLFYNCHLWFEYMYMYLNYWIVCLVIFMKYDIWIKVLLIWFELQFYCFNNIFVIDNADYY